MGLFKQFKDMKNVVAQAPGMIAQAQQTAAAAQAYTAGAAAYGAPAAGAVAPTDPRLAPIAGVDLTLYARISKAASQEGLDADGVLRKAQSYGVPAEAWTAAATGWPTRMRNDMQLAVHYGNIFGQV